MPTTVDDLADLARNLVKAEDLVERAQAALDEATEHARLLREETIPGVMQEMGLDSVRLDSGETLSLKQEVYCSIAKGNKDKAFAWLEKHGHGGLIKTEVTILYGKGELKQATAFAATCIKKKLDTRLEQGVHAATLKAFVGEQIRNRKKIPLTLFGARPVWVAKLTAAKKH